MASLDDAQLYSALIARDARFDGMFFVGVTSTGIYCRPVCRAPKPRREHCRFYRSAAAAERRGFRPCLRCRPELAPGAAHAVSPGDASSTDAVGVIARAAAARIAAGALDAQGLDALAAELGITSRHLRRVVERELGASPVQLAQTRRLLTAKQLLTETDLPLTQVALASGFRSVRRFNALFQERYRLAPSALRRGARAAAGGDLAHEGTVVLSLAYRPAYDWEAMLAYLADRATPGVEAVTSDGRYLRSVRLDGRCGWIAIGPMPSRRAHALRVELSPTLLPVLVPLLARLRRLLDLDAEPAAIAAHLSMDPSLAPLVARRPGLRVPGALDGFELALRTVLGQQVSVRRATALAGRLARTFGEPVEGAPAPLTHLPVAAQRLAEAEVDEVAAVGLPRMRAAALVRLADAVVRGELPELAGVPGSAGAAGAAGASGVAGSGAGDGNGTGSGAPHGADPSSVVRRLTTLPGIGPWTAEYVAMRALRWPDAFPEGDLVLRKAMGGLTPARLRAASEAWRPWRAYAAQHLWTSFGDAAVARPA